MKTMREATLQSIEQLIIKGEYDNALKELNKLLISDEMTEEQKKEMEKWDKEGKNCECGEKDCNC